MWQAPSPRMELLPYHFKFNAGVPWRKGARAPTFFGPQGLTGLGATQGWRALYKLCKEIFLGGLRGRVFLFCIYLFFSHLSRELRVFFFSFWGPGRQLQAYTSKASKSSAEP